MKYTAVLFDAVGTLIYPDPDVISIYHQLGTDAGSRKSKAEIKERFSIAYQRTFASVQQSLLVTDETIERSRWRDVVAYVFADVDVDKTGLFVELWNHFAQPQSWSLFDDVSTTWNELALRNITIGIVSNFDARLRSICDHFPILSDCTNIFISTEIGFSKPDPKLYHQVAQSLEMHPSQLLMVGDSLINDFQAAKTCGWQACLLQRTAAQSQNPEIIRTLCELL